MAQALAICHSRESGNPVTTEVLNECRPGLLDCPVKPGNDNGTLVPLLNFTPDLRSIDGRRSLFRPRRGEDGERARTSPRPIASSPRSCTPTSIRATRRPRRSSSRSPPPTTSSATRRSAGATTAARSTRAARSGRSSAITANMPAAMRARAIARPRATRISARSAICSAICSASGAGHAAAARGGRRFAMRGQDAQYRLDVDFLDAVNGTKTRITLPDGGTLDVTIPPGVTDGQVLRLKGKGNPGHGRRRSRRRADRDYASGRIAVFKREGDDIRRRGADHASTRRCSAARSRCRRSAGRVFATVPPGSNTGQTLQAEGPRREARRRGRRSARQAQRGHARAGRRRSQGASPRNGARATATIRDGS